MKLCPKCHQEKPSDKFRKDKTKKNGREYICRDCRSQREIIWRSKNRLLIRKKQNKYYLLNKQKISEKRKRNYDPIKSKARWLARKIEQRQCVFCEELGERHHKDYSKPLDIVFLCKSHHKQIHDGTIKI